MITGVKLLEAVADHIESNPDSYDQGSWGYIIEKPSAHANISIIEQMGLNACGTRGCIAGWAVALNVNEPQVRDAFSKGLFDVGDMAQRLLNLESYEADILFNEVWEPAVGMSVPEALRQLAKGAEIEEVTKGEYD